MHDRTALGPADVDDETLASMVGSLSGGTEVTLLDSRATEFPYELPAITTAGRYVVSGTAEVDGEPTPYDNSSRSSYFGIIDLAGFRPHSILDTCETESQQELLTTISNQSLPIAAAHHASTLRRLKKPLSKTPSTNQLTLAHPKAHSLLDAEKQTRNLLNKALATMRKNPAPPVKGKGSQGSFSLRPTVSFNLKVDFEVIKKQSRVPLR